MRIARGREGKRLGKVWSHSKDYCQYVTVQHKGIKTIYNSQCINTNLNLMKE